MVDIPEEVEDVNWIPRTHAEVAAVPRENAGVTLVVNPFVMPLSLSVVVVRVVQFDDAEEYTFTFAVTVDALLPVHIIQPLRRRRAEFHASDSPDASVPFKRPP